MKMFKKVSVDGVYVKKAPYEWEGKKYEADIKNGDIVKILNAGTVTTGQFGDQFVFKIETRNGEKNVNFNQSTINVLTESFGDESEGWIGKDVNVITKKDVVAGKKVEVVYLVTEGWMLDEYGELCKKGSKTDDFVNQDIEYPEDEIELP